MPVKDVTKLHKCHLGDQCMLEGGVVQSFIQDFEFWEGGQSSVTWRGCIAHNN